MYTHYKIVMVSRDALSLSLSVCRVKLVGMVRKVVLDLQVHQERLVYQDLRDLRELKENL